MTPEEIRQHREKLGYAHRTDFAKALGGINDQTIYKWETGRLCPSQKMLEKILAAPHYVERGSMDGYTTVPVLRPPLSAGSGVVDQEEEDAVSRLAFRTDWLSRKGSASAMKVFRIKGRSMWPTLNDGDVVLVDTSRTELDVEDVVYAILWGQGLRAKRLRWTLDGQVSVVSDCREEFPPETVAPGDGFKILGRIIWVGREL